METEMIGGPQDGLTLSVPEDCQMLRFPVVLDPGFLAQVRAQGLEKVQMPVAIYHRAGDRFYYKESDV